MRLFREEEMNVKFSRSWLRTAPSKVQGCAHVLSADDAAEDGQGWLSRPLSSSSVQRKAAFAREQCTYQQMMPRSAPPLRCMTILGTICLHSVCSLCAQSLRAEYISMLLCHLNGTVHFSAHLIRLPKCDHWPCAIWKFRRE
jgi:hypothetical protein